MATKSYSRTRNTRPPAYRDGCALAIQLLRALESPERGPFVSYSFDSGERAPGAPQRNVVLEYFDAMRSGGRDVEEGFSAVITDFLAAACQGCVTDASGYEKWMGPEDRPPRKAAAR